MKVFQPQSHTQLLEDLVEYEKQIFCLMAQTKKVKLLPSTFGEKTVTAKDIQDVVEESNKYGYVVLHQIFYDKDVSIVFDPDNPTRTLIIPENEADLQGFSC